MSKITPHLWFDRQAREAAELYTSLIPDSKITNITTLHNTPSGDCDVVSFLLAGQPFMAISAGPLFKFNPSISFHIKCATIGEVDRLWNSFINGGKALMEIGEYPFSQRYGWLQDKYGLSWQIIYAGKDNSTQKIVPALMFTGSVAGKAEEAANFYAEVFKNSTVTVHARYGKDEKPDKEGTVKYASLVLGETELGVMDSAYDHKFGFNEAISFMVPCDSQEEIDYYWSKLSAVLESEQCGWLKDKYGVVWQITPTSMDRMMSQGTPEQIDRVTQAFLKMKKFDLATLQKAYEGK